MEINELQARFTLGLISRSQIQAYANKLNYLRMKSTSYIIMISCGFYLVFLIFSRPGGFIIKFVFSLLVFLLGYFMNPSTVNLRKIWEILHALKPF